MFQTKLFRSILKITRMHSSRMRTARSSGRVGGSPPGTPGADLPQSRSPLEQTPLGADPRSRLPWGQAPPAARHAGIAHPPAARHAGIPPAMYAGIAHTPCCKACWDNTCNACWDTTPPVDRITDACENITLPQLCCGR